MPLSRPDCQRHSPVTASSSAPTQLVEEAKVCTCRAYSPKARAALMEGKLAIFHPPGFASHAA